MTDLVQFVRNEVEETLLRNCTFACLPLEKLSEIADRIEKLEAALREITDGPRDADKSYVSLFYEIQSEARKALEGKDD